MEYWAGRRNIGIMEQWNVGLKKNLFSPFSHHSSISILPVEITPEFHSSNIPGDF